MNVLIADNWANEATRSLQVSLDSHEPTHSVVDQTTVNFHVPSLGVHVNLICQFDLSPSLVHHNLAIHPVVPQD